MKISRLREVEVYSDPANPWVRLYFDEVQFPSGKLGHYNRVVTGPKQAGPGVVVVPVDPELGILLLRNYRYPISRELWELPRGFGEVGANSLESAHRELAEETGFVANRLLDVGPIYPDSGLLESEVHVVVASDLQRLATQGEKDEGIRRQRFWRITQLEGCIRRGLVRDGISLAAIAVVRSAGLM